MNTYQTLNPPQPTTLRPEPAQLGAVSGIEWIQQGWNLFKGNALMWIALMVVMFIIIMIFSMIPLVGLVIALIIPVLMGGLFIAAKATEDGGAPTFNHLFEGFKTHFQPLLIIGALQLAASLVVGAVLGGLIATVGLGAAATGAAVDSSVLMASLGGGFLLFMLLLMPVFMLMGAIFAYCPALVVLHDVAPIDSIKLSLKGSLRNWLPLLVYGILGFVAALIGSIPLFLGLLVVYPVLMLAFYASYKAIFVQR